MIPKILQEIKDKGHDVFTQGDYNLNLVGVRNKQAKPNKFDDSLFVVFKIDGKWTELKFPITTDPGFYYLENPMRVEGAAILVAGQYRGVWILDLHRGRYKALCQRNGKVKVYRDNNLDRTHDHDEASIQEGYFGINIHRASSNREHEDVNKYSAGCQVFADHKDFDLFIKLCEISASKFGNSFTYTLIEK